MFVPGPRLNQVFANRWKAVIWAASILATAYCVADDARKKDDGTASATKAVVGILGGAAASSSAATGSPWDKIPASN